MKMLDSKGEAAACFLHVPVGIKSMPSEKLLISKKV